MGSGRDGGRDRIYGHGLTSAAWESAWSEAVRIRKCPFSIHSRATMETKELASGLLICEEPKPEPKEGIEAYHRLHCRCPMCGGNEFEATCTGGPFTDLEHYRDNNKTCCVSCGWRGIVHNLIPGPEVTELTDPELRNEATKALRILWISLNLSNTQIKLPGSDERRQLWEAMAKKLLGYGIPYGETY